MSGEPCWGNLGGTLGSTFLKDFLRDAGGTWMPGMPGGTGVAYLWGRLRPCGVLKGAFAGHRFGGFHPTIKKNGKNPYKLRLVREKSKSLQEQNKSKEEQKTATIKVNSFFLVVPGQ